MPVIVEKTKNMAGKWVVRVASDDLTYSMFIPFSHEPSDEEALSMFINDRINSSLEPQIDTTVDDIKSKKNKVSSKIQKFRENKMTSKEKDEMVSLLLEIVGDV